MAIIHINQSDFKGLADEILQQGHLLRFRAHGDSMHPFIRHADLLEVEPLGPQPVHRGDIVLCSLENGSLVAHRVVRCTLRSGEQSFLVQGDNRRRPDGFIKRENILGRVAAIERKGERVDLKSASQRLLSWLWLSFAPYSKLIFTSLAVWRAACLRPGKRWLSVLFAVLFAGVGVMLFLAQTAKADAIAESAPELAGMIDLPSSIPSTIDGLRVIRSDDTGILLELAAPEFKLEPSHRPEQTCQTLHANGYAETDIAGWPNLPVRGLMLGIPPGAAPGLTVLDAEIASIPGHFNLCPQSQPIHETGQDGQIYYQGNILQPDARAYATDKFYPSAPIEIVSTGFIRSQAIAQLRFQPFQYNPVSGELQVVRSLRVRVSWPEIDKPSYKNVDEGPFESLLQNVLLNYEDSRSWRSRPALLETSMPGLPYEDAPAYKISIAQDGLYQITYSQLLAADVPVDSLDPQKLRLFNLGSEVAITVTGQADGSFDPSDSILFYGQKTQSRYTDTNVYWLTWGEDSGLRMPIVDGEPGGVAEQPTYFSSTLHLEEDRSYQPDRPSGPDLDTWYWAYIYSSGSPVTRNFTFTVQNLATEPLIISVRGLFMGFAATPQHHTRVLLNGHEIDNAFWPSEDIYTFETQESQAYLINGINTLSVEIPMDEEISLEQVFVNWFELDYYRAYVAADNQLVFGAQSTGTLKYQVGGFTSDDLLLFDITAPDLPSQVENFETESGSGVYTLTFQQAISQKHQYLAMAEGNWLYPLSIIADTRSDLLSTTNGADYILITHPDFYADVLPLASWRESQGYRVKVVDVMEIYDEFSAGIFYPPAIHDFLAYAYANWQAPSPAYVLLVGDGNYDFKNFYLRNEPNYIPPYLADVDPWLRETDADNRFVTIVGNDPLPDMFLGRLPVKTGLETSNMVAKIIGYEQNPPVSGWISQTLFVADNADGDNDFADFSDAVADYYLPAPYTAQKIYYGVTHTSISAAHTAILAAINQGRLVVNYVGHAFLTTWADESLLTRNDIATLTNADRLAFISPMTCLDGYFIHPSRPGLNLSSLGESIVNAAGKGAIASFSPTGLGTSSGHDYLDRGLFEAIFLDDITQLGPATTQAKLFLYANTGGYRDLLETYLLLGDPATRLATLPAESSISLAVAPSGILQPGETITYALTYTNTGPAIAHHVVISDVLSAQVINPTAISSGAVITPIVGANMAWLVDDLAPGAGGMITVTGFIDPLATYPISNTAIIHSSARDTNNLDNVSGPIYSNLSVMPIYFYPAIFR